MLHEFIVEHRAPIVERARSLVMQRSAPTAGEEELAGLPVFLDQLAEQLRRREGAVAGPGRDIGATASARGGAMQRLGLGVAEVVHDYGAVCQAIFQLAAAEGASLESDEYQSLHACLDEAVAEAIGEYTRQREVSREATRDREELTHLGVLAHELRNALSAVVLAFQTLKQGQVGAQGRTSDLIDRNLARLQELVDRSLTSVRLAALAELNLATFTLGVLVEDIEGSAATQAERKGVRFVVSAEAPATELTADRELVLSALSNLVQNALKFTPRGGTVQVRAHASQGRVFVAVSDECGGLPQGCADQLFRPFVRGPRGPTGLGLGLTIARHAVDAHGGSLRAEDRPGVGCTFTMELPQRPS